MYEIIIWNNNNNNNNNVKIDINILGLVNYYSFKYTNSKNFIKKDSVSKVYIQSLLNINININNKFFLVVYYKFIDIINVIHSLDFIHCDIKS